MEQRRYELDLWWRGGEVLLEDHVAFVEAALPRRRLLAGDGKLPLKQKQSSGENSNIIFANTTPTLHF